MMSQRRRSQEKQMPNRIGMPRFNDDVKRKAAGEIVASVSRTGDGNRETTIVKERRMCQVSGKQQLSRGRAVKIQGCQGQTGSRESGIIRQDVESKTCQGQRVPGNHGVRRPGAVPMGSPFSL